MGRERGVEVHAGGVARPRVAASMPQRVLDGSEVRRRDAVDDEEMPEREQVRVQRPR